MVPILIDSFVINLYFLIPRKLVVEHMAERPMTNIMQQSSQGNLLDDQAILLCLNRVVQQWVVFNQYLHVLLREVGCSYAMLEPGVPSRRKHHMEGSQLFNLPEPLKYWCINHIPTSPFAYHMHLGNRMNSWIGSYTFLEEPTPRLGSIKGFKYLNISR